MGILISLDEAIKIRKRLKEEGKTLVFTNGCFDLLHLGHVRYLKKTKTLGDILMVGLNSDSSAQRIKGPLHPLNPQEARAEVLSALKPVDYVVIFNEDTAEEIVAALQPEIYVKGGDYQPQEGEAPPLPEAHVVEQYRGKVVILPMVQGFSTTHIIETILRHYASSSTSFRPQEGETRASDGTPTN